MNALQLAERTTSPQYRFNWIHHNGLWTLVLRVTASGQVLRCGYATQARPDDATGASVAARLFALARREP